MHKLQKQILNDFRKKHTDLTYKEIAKLTGIQVSRIYRVFNGSEIKISEYETLKDTIDQNRKSNFDSFSLIIEQAKETLSKEKIKSIQRSIERSLHQSNLLRNTNFIITNENLQGAFYV